MIRIVRTFGAPVTEPLGNSARRTSIGSAPPGSRDVTVDVSCQTVSYRSASNSRGTSTVPVVETFPRSLRIRSTIIAFSARSFDEASSTARASRSSSTHRPRRDVPFMGRLVTRSPSTRKNSSGEADSTRKRPVETYAQSAARWARQRSR